MAVATRDGDTWSLAPPELVGSADDLVARLRRRARGGGVLIGFDFPIGLPAAYGEATKLDGFPEALRSLGKGVWSDWYNVCERSEQISIRRPFYPMRPGGRRRLHLYEGLSLCAPELLRICDRKTRSRPAASMMFWTLGGAQVGKGAIAGWQGVISPNLGEAALWPFDGVLRELDEKEVVLAETYPADAYGQVGFSRRDIGSKRRQEGRQKAAGAIERWISSRSVDGALVAEDVRDGFSAQSSGEDRFDAFVGLLGMLDVVEGRRPEGCPSTPEIRRWEGWIFGQQADEDVSC